MTLPPSYRPRHVLLIDDNASEIELTRAAIQQSSYHAHTTLHVARDGVEAMEFLHHRGPFETKPRPDLILLDLNMPRMGGREVLELVKGDPNLQTIPVVVLTTSNSSDDIQHAYRAGANCFICKPHCFTQFCHTIDALGSCFLRVSWPIEVKA